jgi:hypothetical protein
MRSAAKLRRLLAGTAAVLLPVAAFAQPQIVPQPFPPGYGDVVKLEVANTDWPQYLPATRFMRTGNSIVIEMEYLSDGFTVSPAFGRQPVTLGELPPGNYTVQARLIDINQPHAASQVVSGAFGVAPPDAWGIYTVPAQPQAQRPIDVVLRSAVYFDPSTVRASVSGNVIRVDFDYYADAPVGGSTPSGATSFATVRVAGFAPGAYHLEGWGRAKTETEPKRYFTRDFTVSSAMSVVEYYSDALDHYFITGGADEIAQLDSGAQGGWKRTGQVFTAWTSTADAPPGAQPVCRFYSRGANSHFYTGDASECGFLQSLEQQQRADAKAQGQTFGGWQYEGIVFYALVPQSGQCPGGTTPVHRAYNNRASEGDPNHRFTADSLMRAAMAGWMDEGVAFCSPS